jgi:hypothetical protein
MMVYVSDVHAQVQKLVSVVKLGSMLEECNTKQQHSVEKITQCKGCS